MGVGLKTYVIALISLLIAHNATAAASATLYLAGTVPDRGFTFENAKTKDVKINLMKDTALKIFAADLSQSEFSNVQNWKKLKGGQALTASSFVRVQAP